MKIKLELWSDQSGINWQNTSSSMWIFFLNGHEFPNKEDSLMTLEQAHKITSKLCDMEEYLNKQNES
jgi:hypothetical protein